MRSSTMVKEDPELAEAMNTSIDSDQDDVGDIMASSANCLTSDPAFEDPDDDLTCRSSVMLEKLLIGQNPNQAYSMDNDAVTGSSKTEDSEGSIRTSHKKVKVDQLDEMGQNSELGPPPAKRKKRKSAVEKPPASKKKASKSSSSPSSKKSASTKVASKGSSSNKQMKDVGSTSKPAPRKKVKPKPVEPPNSKYRPYPFRRNYLCKECDFVSMKPQEFLCHLRDVHGHKLQIHQCTICEYASQHQQKLKRHINLTHLKLGSNSKTKPPAPTPLISSSSERLKLKVKVSATTAAVIEPSSKPVPKKAPSKKSQAKVVVKIKKGDPPSKEDIIPPVEGSDIRCSRCEYTSHSRVMVDRHERVVHLRRKFFRCGRCPYVTHVRSRYTKHMKCHTRSDIKCSHCDFTTPHRLTLERHIKIHKDLSAGSENEVVTRAQNLAPHNGSELHKPSNPKSSRKRKRTRRSGKSTNKVKVDEKSPIIRLSSDILDLDGGNLVIDEDRVEPPNSPRIRRSRAKAVSATSSVCTNEATSPSKRSRDSLNISNPVYDSPRKLSRRTVQRRDFNCKVCPFRASSTSELLAHERCHSPPRPPVTHACFLCGLKFQQRSLLQIHFREVHRVTVPVLSRLPASSMRRIADLESLDVELCSQPKLRSLLTSPKLANNVKLSKLDECDALLALSKERQILQCEHCSYEAKWISELVKHQRVHTQEKPYMCLHCTFRSRWKGDLTRHVHKYHSGEAVEDETLFGLQNEENTEGIEQLMDQSMMVGTEEELIFLDDGRALALGGGTTKRRSTVSVNLVEIPVEEKDSPLDLSIGPDTSSSSKQMTPDEMGHVLDLSHKSGNAKSAPQKRSTRMVPLLMNSFESPDRGELVELVEDDCDEALPTMHALDVDVAEEDVDIDAEGSFASHLLTPTKSILSMSSSDRGTPRPGSTGVGGKTQRIRTLYQCPKCTFTAPTASRFHVHFVVHMNKRPFMCSECSYRSNWEWDVKKHIKIKASKGTSHSAASLVIVNEYGRRNYEKYDRYIIYEVVEKDGTQPEALSLEEPDRSSSTLPTVKSNVSTVQTRRSLRNGLHRPLPTSTEKNLVDEPEYHVLEEHSAESPTIITGKKILWKCRYCDFEHVMKRVIIRHAVVHSSEKKFWCGICGQASNWHHCVLRHCKTRHDSTGPIHELDPLAPVPSLSANSLSSAAVQIIKDEIKSSKCFSCPICPYQARKMFNLKMHSYLHQPRPGAIFKCMFCPFYVSVRRSLIQHMKLHVKESQEAQRSSSNLQGGGLLSVPLSDFSAAMNEYEPINEVVENLVVNDEAVHACDQCPYITTSPSQLLYHKQFHRPHRMAAHHCNMCSYSVSSAFLMRQHQKLHEDAAEWKVQQNDSDQLPLHINEQVIVNTDQQAVDASEIPLVWVSKGGAFQKMFKCRFCPHVNKKKCIIIEHEKRHQKQKAIGKFACSLCNYKCNNQGVLSSHMKVHRNVVQVHAYVNEEETAATLASVSSGKMELQHSAENVATQLSESTALSPSGKTILQCPKCPAQFSKHRVWKVHLSFHGAHLPWKCDSCDYAAKHRPHLHKHLMVHADKYGSKKGSASKRTPPVLYENNTGCDISKNSRVTARKRTNPNVFEKKVIPVMKDHPVGSIETKQPTIKKHQCHLCPAIFLKPANLMSHLRLHGGKGRYRCKHCTYTVVNMGNLVRHVKIHEVVAEAIPPSSGLEDPCPREDSQQEEESIQRSVRLRCPKCLATFEKQSRFDIHIRLHGSNQSYRCSQCDYAVNYVANLSKHQKSHHDTEPTSSSQPTNSTILLSCGSKANLTTLHPKSSSISLKSESQHKEELASICAQGNSANSGSSCMSDGGVRSHGTARAGVTSVPGVVVGPTVVEQQQLILHRLQTDASKVDVRPDFRKLFRCNRCPYINNRKDAVQSHMKRHRDWKESSCPYCDYGSTQHSFLREHSKLHFRPLRFHKVEGFLQCDDYEIWAYANGTSVIIFRTSEMLESRVSSLDHDEEAEVETALCEQEVKMEKEAPPCGGNSFQRNDNVSETVVGIDENEQMTVTSLVEPDESFSAEEEPEVVSIEDGVEIEKQKELPVCVGPQADAVCNVDNLDSLKEAVADVQSNDLRADRDVQCEVVLQDHQDVLESHHSYPHDEVLKVSVKMSDGEEITPMMVVNEEVHSSVKTSNENSELAPTLECPVSHSKESLGLHPVLEIEPMGSDELSVGREIVIEAKEVQESELC